MNNIVNTNNFNLAEEMHRWKQRELGRNLTRIELEKLWAILESHTAYDDEFNAIEAILAAAI